MNRCYHPVGSGCRCPQSYEKVSAGELFQLTVVYGNFDTRAIAEQLARVIREEMGGRVVDVQIKGSFSK